MAPLIWVISMVLLSFITLIVTTWICNITDSSNSLIHNNKYNKYKIYYDASCDLYYCKMVTNYLLGIIPIWRKVKYSVPSGFEDSVYEVWYEDNSEIIRLEMNKSYTEYCERNDKLKAKARVVYKSYE
jgi:hypothetical protein